MVPLTSFKLCYGTKSCTNIFDICENNNDLFQEHTNSNNNSMRYFNIIFSI